MLIVTAVPGLLMGLVYKFSDAIPASTVLNNSAEKVNNRRLGKLEASRLVLFLVSVILRVVAVTALLNFLPTIFVNFFGLPESRAAYATAFYFVGGVAGSLLAGKLSEHFNSFAVILVGTVFIAFTLPVLAGNLPVWTYVIIVMLFGAFGSGCIINQNLLISRLGQGLGKGEVFGILMGTMTVTSALGPGIFGLVIDSIGYRSALYIFTLPLLISIIILAYLLKTDRAVKPAEV